MSKKMLSGLLVLAVMSLGLISARNVYRYTFELDNYETWLAADTHCDFDIAYHEAGTLATTLFYTDGQLTRDYTVLANAKQTISANGKSLDIRTVTVHTRLLSEDKFVVEFLGVSDFIVIPGLGQVWGTGGHYDLIFQYDPETDDWIEVGLSKGVGSIHFEDFSLICDYLAP